MFERIVMGVFYGILVSGLMGLAVTSFQDHQYFQAGANLGMALVMLSIFHNVYHKHLQEKGL